MFGFNYKNLLYHRSGTDIDVKFVVGLNLTLLNKSIKIYYIYLIFHFQLYSNIKCRFPLLSLKKNCASNILFLITKVFVVYIGKHETVIN